MREEGLEPTRSNEQQILSLPCLPIPPFPPALLTDAEGETRTPTNRFTRPSNVRVYQFRHFGLQNFQYRKRDLNPHELYARCALNAVRLPIPPFRLIKHERDKTRTCDPYRVGVVLYRLSHAPAPE
jgi:hypothetical protein